MRHGSRASTTIPLAVVLVLGLAMVIGTSATTASAAVPTASAAKSKPPGIYTLLGITCRTANDCNAVGKNNPGDIAAVRTTDGGVKWQIDSAPKVPLYLQSVACPTAKNCVAVGYAGSGGGYTPVSVDSTDGGTKWEVQTLPISSGLLFGVACRTSLDCEAVGTVDTATSSTAGFEPSAPRTAGRPGGRKPSRWPTPSLPSTARRPGSARPWATPVAAPPWKASASGRRTAAPAGRRGACRRGTSS